MSRSQAVVAAILAAAAMHGRPGFAQAGAAEASAPRQLVVPFESAGAEPRFRWLTEASAVIVTDDLLALGASPLSRDDRLRAMEQLRVPALASLSRATVIRLGQIVGAAQVVVGTFAVKDDVLTVRARTIRLDVGRMSPEIVEQGPLGDLFAIYARVSRQIDPGSRVTPEQLDQDRPSPAAFEQFIKGLLAEAPSAKISYLTEALRLAPSFHQPRIALWKVYDDQGSHGEALQVVRAVPAGQPSFRRARFLSSVSMLNLAQYQEAFDTLNELNQAAPHAALLNNLGVIQLRRGAGAPGGGAVSYFAEAAKTDANDADLLFNLGYAYLLERDLTPAMASLREAVRRDPADAEAHYVLGVALQTAGNIGEAAREKELARRLSTQLAEFDATQAGANNVPRALERVKTDMAAPDSLRLDSAIVAAGQRDQRALATFHLDAGRRQYQAGRDDEAIAELRRAVYLSPYQSEAHLLLGRLYLRTGRLPESIDALKISLWSEDRIAAHVALGEAYIAAKDPAAARAELELVLSRDAQNAEARRLLAGLRDVCPVTGSGPELLTGDQEFIDLFERTRKAPHLLVSCD